MLASLDCIVHDGACVFTTVPEQKACSIPRGDALFEFRETEGVTLILTTELADEYEVWCGKNHLFA